MTSPALLKTGPEHSPGATDRASVPAGQGDQFIPMTRTVDLGNGVRGIDGFVPITTPYGKQEMKIAARAIADLMRGGIAWRFGDDRCIYRETLSARPMESDEEEEEL